MRISLLLPLAALLLTGAAPAADSFTVAPTLIRDPKAVFATLEGRNIVPARVRSGGTMISLSVREGDKVTQGQVIAVIADRRLGQQSAALAAQIAGLKAQRAQAEAELERNRALFDNGVLSQSDWDGLRTALAVAEAALKAREAEHAALEEQIAQGQVLAPVTGRVLTLPMIPDAVAMPGEVVATVARQDLVVRMLLPERHARSLAIGDKIHFELDGLAREAAVSQIYPHIAEGQIQVDLAFAGDDQAFVGQRVRAWIPGEPRSAIIVPAAFLSARFGVDYARLAGKEGAAIEVPVQRGQAVPLPDGAEGVEILSGLKAGDQLVRP
jgi:RND family efflux transporter MFP subunit